MAYGKQMGDLMLTLCVFLPALNLEKWKTGPLSDRDSEMTIPGQHFRSTPRNYWPLSQAESGGGGMVPSSSCVMAVSPMYPLDENFLIT